MTRIRMVWLSVLAVCAAAAITAAAASAFTNPILVKSNGEAVTNVSVTSKSAAASIPTLQRVGGGKVECAAETDTAKLSTSGGMTSGTATVKFTGCTGAAGNCQNTATTGEITGTVSVLLVWVGKESNKTIGLLISILPYSGSPGSQNGLLSYRCGTAKVLADRQGSFIALTNKKLNELFTTGKLIATQAGGVQKDLKYTENGVEGTNTLYANEAGGTFEQTGEELESEETYSTSVKVVES
jgi:hypothetical protein